jgi:hypothetical protein
MAYQTSPAIAAFDRQGQRFHEKASEIPALNAESADCQGLGGGQKRWHQKLQHLVSA